MNKTKFKPRGIGETIEALCPLKGEPVWSDGSINQSALSAKTKVNQGLISRILRGVTQTMGPENVEKMAYFFGVSLAQMRGEEPIPVIDGAVSAQDQEFIDRFPRLPDDLKQALLALEAGWPRKP